MNYDAAVRKSLKNLGIKQFVIKGNHPKNNDEFLSNVYVITGTDPNGDEIESNDPLDVKVSWTEIEAEVARLQKEQPKKEIREYRDRLLTESDWVTIRATDTGDPVPTEWQTYRQALRDIPEQTGFPDNVEWPQEPES